MIDDPARSAGGTLGEYTYRETGRERSMAEVLRDIVGNAQEMIRSEIRLARAELREEAQKTASSAKMLGIGAGLGFFATAFALVTLTLLLALVVPAWAASLIMAVVLGLPAAALIVKGKAQLAVPTPQKTIENVKENVEWVKSQTRS
jgi:uncharacterized membrane protein YqjE